VAGTLEKEIPKYCSERAIASNWFLISETSFVAASKLFIGHAA
jgi:hypothetical protein